MQLALQDIKILGYKKIGRRYLNSEFISKLKDINNLYYSMRIPAYSLLNKWYLVESLAKDENIRGYTSFVYGLEPMIGLTDSPDASSKRKCRNSWSSIWDNIGSISELDECEIMVLSDFGLKILFIYASCMIKGNDELDKFCCYNNLSCDLYKDLQDILNFYNVVLTWALFTQQESNFTKNNLSFIDVLSMLVLCNEVEFEEKLKSLY